MPLRQHLQDPVHQEGRIVTEIYSSCHPFFTGKQRLLDVAGRVERFIRKYAGTRKAAPAKA